MINKSGYAFSALHTKDLYNQTVNSATIQDVGNKCRHVVHTRVTANLS